MAQQKYASTDPNFGTEQKYVSTDPNFGLSQQDSSKPPGMLDKLKQWAISQLESGGRALAGPTGEAKFGGKVVPELSNQPSGFGNAELGAFLQQLAHPVDNAPTLAATAATMVVPGAKAGATGVTALRPMFNRLMAATGAGTAGAMVRGDANPVIPGLVQGGLQLGGEAVMKGGGALFEALGPRMARRALNPTDPQLTEYWLKKHGSMDNFDFKRAKQEMGREALDVSRHSPTTSSYHDEIRDRVKAAVAEKDRMVAAVPPHIGVDVAGLGRGTSSYARTLGRIGGADPQGAKQSVIDTVRRTLDMDEGAFRPQVAGYLPTTVSRDITTGAPFDANLGSLVEGPTQAAIPNRVRSAVERHNEPMLGGMTTHTPTSVLQKPVQYVGEGGNRTSPPGGFSGPGVLRQEGVDPRTITDLPPVDEWGRVVPPKVEPSDFSDRRMTTLTPQETLDKMRSLDTDLLGRWNARNQTNVTGAKDVVPPEDRVLEMVRSNAKDDLNAIVPPGQWEGQPIEVGDLNDLIGRNINWQGMALRGTGEAADSNIRMSVGPGGKPRATLFNALEELMGRAARPTRGFGRGLNRAAEQPVSPVNLMRIIQAMREGSRQGQ